MQPNPHQPCLGAKAFWQKTTKRQAKNRTIEL